MGALHGPERGVWPPGRGEGFVRRLLPAGHAAVLALLQGLRATAGLGMGPRGKLQGKRSSAPGSGCTFRRTRWTTSPTGTRVRTNGLLFRQRMCQTSRGQFFRPCCPPHYTRPRRGIRTAGTDTSKTGISRSSGCSRVTLSARSLTTAARGIGCLAKLTPMSSIH